MWKDHAWRALGGNEKPQIASIFEEFEGLWKYEEQGSVCLKSELPLEHHICCVLNQVSGLLPASGSEAQSFSA